MKDEKNDLPDERESQESQSSDWQLSGSEFPVAQTQAFTQTGWRKLSRMWVVTLACLMLAIGLTWYSIDSPGPEIVIHFAEGHGLKPGDSLRHRGIDVGHVTSVSLDTEMAGIDVSVVLHAQSAKIASEGSRFWIVRPQLDLTGVSGLETAVGSKYIAVIPGQSGTRQSEFDGLATRPPDGIGQGGVEIVLRGDDRYGVNPGSPVTWRGIEVGQVIASSLSADALHVDTRVRIMETHRRLLARNSKFWVTSGVRLKMGVTGVELDTETLDEIARGGIAFITPGKSQSDDGVRAGDIFTLHAKLDDRWIEAAAALNRLESEPPPIATVVASWKQKHFGITRTHQLNAAALAIAGVSGPAVLIPADMLSRPGQAINDSYQLLFQSGESEISLAEASPGEGSSSNVALIPLPSDQLVGGKLIDRNRVRAADSPEDCFVIRRSPPGESEGDVLIETIEKQQLSDGAEMWQCTLTRLSRDLWHGAPVLSAADEKIIGLLIVSDDGISVATLPASLVD